MQTGSESIPEYFNQATCFISWNNIGDDSITGITEAQKNNLLTDLNNEVATLNNELYTSTSSITTVDANGNSAGDGETAAYPYGNDIYTYNYSAITGSIQELDQLLIPPSDITYKIQYAIEANNYGVNKLSNLGLTYVNNTYATDLEDNLNITNDFLNDTALAPFNDYECQLTINVDVNRDTQTDVENGATTTYTYDRKILVSDTSCPENILAVALSKIESTTEGRITNTNVGILTFPHVVGSETFADCGEFLNREGVAPYHFIEININVSTNDLSYEFPQNNFTFAIKSGQITNNRDGDLELTFGVDKNTPPIGDVVLSTIVGKTGTEHSFFIQDVYPETLVTSSSRVCYYWDNSPFEP